jgi:hypothetical protein
VTPSVGSLLGVELAIGESLVGGTGLPDVGASLGGVVGTGVGGVDVVGSEVGAEVGADVGAELVGADDIWVAVGVGAGTGLAATFAGLCTYRRRAGLDRAQILRATWPADAAEGPAADRGRLATAPRTTARVVMMHAIRIRLRMTRGVLKRSLGVSPA